MTIAASGGTISGEMDMDSQVKFDSPARGMARGCALKTR